MSIAWSGVVLLVLLLPGFLFFVGLYFPEKFTREVVERSPLAQLAGTVLIAFLVHGALFLFNRLACGGLLPCIDLGEVLGVISLDGAKSPDAVRMVARALSDDPGWIFGYMLVASAMGTGLGWFTGMQVVLGPFRFLAQHRWVYDLPLEGDVMAMRMTGRPPQRVA